MGYVELKHLLSALALEAVADPRRAAWVAVALACAERASPGESRILWPECLARAGALAAPFGWKPTRRDLTRLVKRGLFVTRGDLVALPPAFAPHLDYFKRQTARLLKAIAEMHGTERTRGAARAVSIAAVLFNAGLFFECHEWGEGLWKQAPAESKGFYHGLVQVAAAFYHHEKGNTHGSRTLLAKGLARLQPFPDTYLGIDLEHLRKDLALWTRHFAGGARPADFPRIHAAERKEGAPGGYGSALEGVAGDGAPSTRRIPRERKD